MPVSGRRQQGEFGVRRAQRQSESSDGHAGRDDGVRAEILSGLSVDDLVVETPGEDLAEGTPVETEIIEATGHHRLKAGPEAAPDGGAARKR